MDRLRAYYFLTVIHFHPFIDNNDNNTVLYNVSDLKIMESPVDWVIKICIMVYMRVY